MESRLQSNEVRIPKTTSATLTITNGILSSSSSISNNNNNPSMTTSSPKRFENFSSKHANNLPDFDFSSPCQYFKSSFARSLSMSAGSNQTKSLDFGINFGLSQTSSIREEPQTPVALGSNNSSSSSPPLPLPRSQHPSMILTNGLSNSHVNGSANHPSNNNSNCSSNNNTKCNSRNVWSTSHKQNLYRRSLDSTEIEVLRLRKECQNLIEENRRLMGLASSIVGGNLVVPGNSPNIEAVILQTQVDTLQWQLKQVEASRQMYRAVMEEVVRFLERCHRNLDSIQNEQIARSKSIHHVYQRNDILSTNNIIDCNNPTTSPRARSSTNLIDVQKTACQSSNNNNNNNNKLMINDDTTNSLPATSYNNFRDFTWRRSPKRPASAQLATSECDPEKLSQEAFRLLRTAQNLLNTQEPDLTQPKHTIEFQYNNPLLTTSSSSSSSTTTTSTGTGTATAASSAAVVSSSAPTNTIKSNQSLSLSSSSTNSDSFCLTFSRKMNIRESRLSLRSSTDGSVHSTSSSKNETDEENHSPPICKETTTICNSTTEDESGFSSISSFQEIGLPLNSTMISSPIPPIISSSISDDSGESNIIDTQCIDNNSRNSTLKGSSAAATTTTTTITLATASISSSPLHLTSNNIGLPLNQQQQQQRKWESAPAVPPRTNLHRFSTLPTDDTPTVLWV